MDLRCNIIIMRCLGYIRLENKKSVRVSGRCFCRGDLECLFNGVLSFTRRKHSTLLVGNEYIWKEVVGLLRYLTDNERFRVRLWIQSKIR